MNPQNQPAIGIDLGTTYSAVAMLDKQGQPQTLENSEGDKITPSVLLLKGDNVIVGKEAVKAMATHHDAIADHSKRYLGQRSLEQEFGGVQYPPEALQAWILMTVWHQWHHWHPMTVVVWRAVRVRSMNGKAQCRNPRVQVQVKVTLRALTVVIKGLKNYI